MQRELLELAPVFTNSRDGSLMDRNLKSLGLVGGISPRFIGRDSKLQHREALKLT